MIELDGGSDRSEVGCTNRAGKDEVEQALVL